MGVIQKKAALLVSLALVLSAAELPVLAADNGVGTVTELASSLLATGVTMRKLQAADGSKKQNIHTLTFSVPQSDYMVLPYFGDDLFSRHTLTSMAEHAEKQGYEIVGGINGDFFNVDGEVTGMPVGPLLQNGRVVCSEDIPPNITGDKAPAWQTMAFKRDGTSVIGHMVLNKSMVVVGENGSAKRMGFTLFNRKMTASGVHVYTSDYGKTVRNANPAFAVTLSVEQGGFGLDETVVCRVVETASGVKDVPIPAGRVVLCAYENSGNQPLIQNTLKVLRKGQRIDLKLSGGNLWKGAYQAISGPDAVLTKGAVTVSSFVKETNYPSTLVGAKADGTVVMAQVDGRNVGGSYGLSAKQAGQYMKSLGCVNALLLDGGGSSEMVAGTSGQLQILNHPSDGAERRIGTCLLLAKKTEDFLRLPDVKPAPPYDGTATEDTGKGETATTFSQRTETSGTRPPKSTGSDKTVTEGDTQNASETTGIDAAVGGETKNTGFGEESESTTQTALGDSAEQVISDGDAGDCGFWWLWIAAAVTAAGGGAAVVLILKCRRKRQSEMDGGNPL